MSFFQKAASLMGWAGLRPRDVKVRERSRSEDVARKQRPE